MARKMVDGLLEIEHVLVLKRLAGARAHDILLADMDRLLCRRPSGPQRHPVRRRIGIRGKADILD